MYAASRFTTADELDMTLASEALHGGPTFARRWPALVAFLFGLVHGLRFAGALKEIGLPQQHLPGAARSAPFPAEAP